MTATGSNWEQHATGQQGSLIAPGGSPHVPALPRAESPRPPDGTAQTDKANAARNRQRLLQEVVERKRMLRGLLLLALAVLLGSMLRAGWERVFVPGWWRQW